MSDKDNLGTRPKTALITRGASQAMAAGGTNPPTGAGALEPILYLGEAINKFCVGLKIQKAYDSDTEDESKIQDPTADDIEILGIYQDIQNLSLLLSDKVRSAMLSENDWQATTEAAQNTIDRLKALKTAERKADKNKFEFGKGLYLTNFNILVAHIDVCNKLFTANKADRERQEQDALDEAAHAADAANDDEVELPPAILLQMAEIKKQMNDMQRERMLYNALDFRMVPPPPIHTPYKQKHRVKYMTCTNFSGDKKLFPTFKKIFQSVYEDEGISNKDLAIRLFEHLEGEPKKQVHIIFHYSLDENTYKQMWVSLDKLYGGDYVWKKLVANQVTSLKLFRKYEYESIRTFYDFIQNQVVYYQKFEPILVDSEHNFLYTMIKSKMTYKIGMDYRAYMIQKGLPDSLNSIYIWINEIYTSCLIGKEENEPLVLDQSNPRSISRKLANAADFASDSDSSTEISSDSTDSDESQSKVIGQLRKFVKNYKPKTQKVEFKCYECKNGKHSAATCSSFKKLNQRERYLVTKTAGLCYHCLNGIHRVKECTNNTTLLCGENGCERYHHKLLHKTDKVNKIVKMAKFNITNSETDSDLTCVYKSESGNANMQTFVAQLSGTIGQDKIVCMLDSGSNTTCIDEELANELDAMPLTRLKNRSVKYLDRVVKVLTRCVRVTLTNLDNTECIIIDAWTIPKLSEGTRAVDWSNEKSHYDHLKDINFPKLPDNKEIKLLVGNRNSDCFVPEEIRKGTEPNQPFGYKTPFGWTVLGSNQEKFDKLSKNESNYKLLFSKAVRIN